MGPTFNYFWDNNDPAKPFSYSDVCNAIALVPDNATRTPVPEYQKGTIPCWDGKKWVVKLDWRQQKLYSKETGKLTGYPTVDADSAEVEKSYTAIAPTSPYDKWKDGKWVVDEGALKAAKISELMAQRTELVNLATKEVSLISDIVLFKEDSGAEDLPKYEALYKSWRLYRGKLASMSFVTGDETFPEQPTKLEDFK